jgi:hypothetical protein
MFSEDDRHAIEQKRERLKADTRSWRSPVTPAMKEFREKKRKRDHEDMKQLIRNSSFTICLDGKHDCAEECGWHEYGDFENSDHDKISWDSDGHGASKTPRSALKKLLETLSEDNKGTELVGVSADHKRIKLVVPRVYYETIEVPVLFKRYRLPDDDDDDDDDEKCDNCKKKRNLAELPFYYTARIDLPALNVCYDEESSGYARLLAEQEEEAALQGEQTEAKENEREKQPTKRKKTQHTTE